MSDPTSRPTQLARFVTLRRGTVRHVTSTLELPAHTAVGVAGAYHYDPATITVTYLGDDAPSVQHAINLLETLFAHGVTSTEQLAYVLTITGNPNRTP